MSHKPFRLYRFVDSPFQFFGLKMEQVALGLMGGFGFFISDDIPTKILILILTGVVISVQKRIAKRFEGVSTKSYVWWVFGFSLNLGSHFPTSATRQIVGD